MKRATYKDIDFTMTKTGYGQYTLSAVVEGRTIKLHSTDSEMYDYLDDEEDEIKHNDALEAAWRAVDNYIMCESV